MRAISWSSLPERIRHGDRAQFLGAAGVMGAGLAVLAILYLGLPIFIIPALILVVILAFVTLRWPIIGVLAVVAAQYFPYSLGDYTLFQLTGAGVAGLILVFIGLTRKGWVFSNIVPPILVFTLLTINSLSFTHDTNATHYLVRKLVFNGLFLLLLVNIVDDFRKLRWLLGLLVGMGLLNSVVAVPQFMGRVIKEGRARGLQGNENQLGEIAGWSLIILFHLFLYSKTRRRQVGALILGAVVAAGLVTSISRAAVLSVLAGLAWMALRERRYRGRFLLLAVLIAVMVPFLPGAFFRRFEGVNEALRGTLILTGRTGLTDRGYFNRAGLKIWRAHPIVGVGLGNFGYYYVQSEFNPGYRGGRGRLPPHNLYVQALAETGTVGFLVLMWWIFEMVRNYRLAERRRLTEPLDVATVRACEMITLVALMIYFTSGNLVYTNFHMIMAMSYLCRRSAQGVLESRAPVPAEAGGGAA